MADRPLILVADDDEDILALVGLRLEREGYEVVTARDGAEALESAAARRPDLVVVDVMMPRVDGHEVVRRLRSREATRDVPIIVLTAAVHDRVAEASAEAGADLQLRKPFSPRELAERIGLFLGRA